MEKMLHVSMPADMFEPRVEEDGEITYILPRAAKGKTYNVGRNAAKRAKREERAKRAKR